MALVDNGIRVSVPSGQLPAGASAQAVTPFTDHEYTRRETFSVLKSTVDDANKATTFDNILNNATIGVKAQVTALVTADYISSNTVTYFSEITAITSNIAGNTTVNDFYNDTPVSYLCSVTIYIKTA